MDPWNPIIANSYIKRVSDIVIDLVLAAMTCIVGVWVIAVLVLSLERNY